MKHAASWIPQLLILFGILLLISLSLLSLRSVAPEAFTAQLTFVLIAALIAFGLSRLDYHLYTFSAWPWYLLTLTLLGITLVFGDSTRGATRWLNLFGLSLQTSEIAKPFFILFLAVFVVNSYPTKFRELIRFIVLLTLPILLAFFQPDLGTAIIYAIIAFSGLIASGIGFKHLLLFLTFFLVLVPLFFPLLKPYQRERLTTFINQNHDPQGAGYNARQALIAVGSGKFLGRGLGQGTQSHLRFLPERHTDFIYASIVEELGFIGGIIIVIAFGLIATGLIQAGKHASSETGAIICLVSLSAILLQAFINLGMNMGLLPVTGITLPFVSSGGSSYISLGVILGICLSVAARPQHSRQILQIR